MLTDTTTLREEIEAAHAEEETFSLNDLGGSHIPASVVTRAQAAAQKETGGSVSTTYKGGRTSSAEDRALALLGSGVPPEQVAAALGVSPSRISQLMSDDNFSERVATLRFDNLQSHNKRDSAYDVLEDKLLVKLEKSIPFMIKPEAILSAIKIVNNAKRRGQSAPAQQVNQQSIVTLVMPTVITQKFAVNLDNQVIRAGDQDLLTMPSGNLLDRVEAASAKKLLDSKAIPHDSQDSKGPSNASSHS